MKFVFSIIQSINEEEQLLEWEITPFMNLGNMLAAVEPYQQLWRTVYDWHINNDKWYYGKRRQIFSY